VISGVMDKAMGGSDKTFAKAAIKAIKGNARVLIINATTSQIVLRKQTFVILLLKGSADK
jgi:hypothetical protein